jgi:hypothetical protein
MRGFFIYILTNFIMTELTHEGGADAHMEGAQVIEQGDGPELVESVVYERTEEYTGRLRYAYASNFGCVPEEALVEPRTPIRSDVQLAF